MMIAGRSILLYSPSAITLLAESDCPHDPSLEDQSVDPATVFTSVLGPLRDNGGSTFTHALRPDSPAIDTGDPDQCPATDQRGVSRPQGAGCDIRRI